MKKQLRPQAQATVACVIEVLHYRSGDKQGVSCVVSQPGRDGTFLRFWPAAYGQLDADQLRDLIGWLQSTCSAALVDWSGIQEVLPG